MSTPNAFLYDRRCIAYWRQKKPDLAIADCSQALQIKPADSIAYVYLAGAYLEKRLWDLAIADADKALKLNPNSASAYFARGFGYEHKEVLSLRALALADYNEAVALDPNMSFFIADRTDMPFNSTPIPPTAGFEPAGYRPITRLDGLYYRGLCYGGANVGLYNDFTVAVYFDVFNEPVNEQKDADPANWTKFGRVRLGPGESTTLTFAKCVTGRAMQWHFWVRNLRFGSDTGPALFPATDETN